MNPQDLPLNEFNKWSAESFDESNRMFSRILEMKQKNQKKSNSLQEKINSENRPDRETVIGNEDLTNLKIALGNANNVDDFLKNL